MGVSVVSFDKNVVLSSFFVFDRFRFLSRFSFRGITMVSFSVVLLMLAWASIGEGLPPLPPGVNLGVQGCVNTKNWANVICQNGVLVGCDTGDNTCWKQCAGVQDAGTDTRLLIGHCYPTLQNHLLRFIGVGGWIAHSKQSVTNQPTNRTTDRPTIMEQELALSPVTHPETDDTLSLLFFLS